MSFLRHWPNHPAYRSGLRLRRRLAEAVGVYRYSSTGYWDFLQQHLPRQSTGVFLEAGAHDGWSGSNTYSLEACWGWRGLLVEPDPAQARECRRNRRSPVIPCALVPPDFPGREIILETAGLLSTVLDSPLLEQSRQSAHNYYGDYAPRQISVPARTLDSLLREHGLPGLDFLSLDVEGFEEPALRGLDFDHCAPKFILVEANYPDAIHALLAPRYDLVARLGLCDRFYALR
jgi:FkbM family methyltransferase